MTEEKPNMIVMTQEQFGILINKFTEANESPSKSFAQCTAKYNGERSYNKVTEFISNITIYKKIERISDDDALEGLTLLLTDTAATWWSGVKNDVKKWNHALEAIKSAFAPKMQPHEVYLELFAKKQTTESIDSFICEKRALLAQLPSKRHKEEEQLDLIYGLLKVEYKKEIPRTNVKSFAELLEKGRHIESLGKEAGESSEATATSDPQPSTGARKIPKRCSFCGKKGHTFDVCRKRLAQIPETKPKEEGKITCYGFGAPGVFRSNCDTCKNKETPPKPVAFYAVQSTVETQVKIPTIQVSIKGEQGYAYIDTAARTSIASTQLYKTLLQKVPSLINEQRT